MNATLVRDMSVLLTQDKAKTLHYLNLKFDPPLHSRISDLAISRTMGYKKDPRDSEVLGAIAERLFGSGSLVTVVDVMPDEMKIHVKPGAIAQNIACDVVDAVRGLGYVVDYRNVSSR